MIVTSKKSRLLSSLLLVRFMPKMDATAVTSATPNAPLVKKNSRICEDQRHWLYGME